MVHNLSLQYSAIIETINFLRNKDIQNNKLLFRHHLHQFGVYVAYEISKTLSSKIIDVQTPLGTAHTLTLNEEIIIASILRAGLPLHQGLLQVFDNSVNGFIGSYRTNKKNDKGDLEIALEYLSSPKIEGQILLLADPMLATGHSFCKCLEALIKQKGQPKHVHIICVIASQSGVDYVASQFPNATIWCGAIDAHLNDKKYIIPGLGDAGDLAFGKKD